MPHWSDRHPDHVAASRVLTEAVFNAGCDGIRQGATRGRREWVCYYFINDSSAPSFVIDVSQHYETKRRALACHVSQFTPAPGDSVSTRLTTHAFGS